MRWPNGMRLARTRYTLGWIAGDAPLSPALPASTASRLLRGVRALVPAGSDLTGEDGARATFSDGALLPTDPDDATRVLFADRAGVPIWTRVLIGLVAGALTGAVFGERILWLDPVGQAFIAAIKMLVVPLIFVSLVGGISSIGDLGRMGRIGGRTVGWYLVTTAAAIPVGLAIAVWLQPGAGMGLMPPSATAATETPSLADSLVVLFRG